METALAWHNEVTLDVAIYRIILRVEAVVTCCTMERIELLLGQRAIGQSGVTSVIRGSKTTFVADELDLFELLKAVGNVKVILVTDRGEL